MSESCGSSITSFIASRGQVGYQKPNPLFLHAVSSILLEQKTSHQPIPARMMHHHVLLTLPNVTINHSTVLNPVTLLPTEADGEPHDCLAAIVEVCSP